MLSVRLIPGLESVRATQWDGLHGGPNPFLSHSFLYGLEKHACLREEWGWTPRHLTLWDGDELVAAAPGYVKTNSHGEFVFDHAWAHAYARHGLEYFPKWLCAVPYSPVVGPRLLARTNELRQTLVRTMVDQCDRQGWSSMHVNFLEDETAAVFDDDWLCREDIQYHWNNTQGWMCFDDFLAALDHKHRKNIRQERTRVARTGIRFRTVSGGQASAQDISLMHGFYRQTFTEYGNHPALTLEFFGHLASSMPHALVMFIAERGNEPIAGALCLRSDNTLYGRYWGATEQVPGLHFETCYYQGIEYCLREGLTRFEPGAQGEHKLARGFLPAFVRSRHWIAHEGFREVLRDWCLQEAASVRRYARTLAAHSPFKAS